MALRDTEAKLAYRQAMNDVIRYYYSYCVDLYNFVELAQQNLAARIAAGKIPQSQQTSDLNAATEELKNYIKDHLVLYNFTVGTAGTTDYSKSHGISIYMPVIKTDTDVTAAPVFLIAPSTLATKYTDLQFDKATGWSAFVDYLTTRDPPPAN